MNPIRQSGGFFRRTTLDERLNPFHISLYMAICYLWETSGAQNPVSVSRLRLMHASKINARGTYHKCIRELQDFGYINYKPSYHPHEGSNIYLLLPDTCSTNGQVESRTCSTNEQVKKK